MSKQSLFARNGSLAIAIALAWVGSSSAGELLISDEVAGLFYLDDQSGAVTAAPNGPIVAPSAAGSLSASRAIVLSRQEDTAHRINLISGASSLAVAPQAILNPVGVATASDDNAYVANGGGALVPDVSPDLVLTAGDIVRVYPDTSAEVIYTGATTAQEPPRPRFLTAISLDLSGKVLFANTANLESVIPWTVFPAQINRLESSGGWTTLHEFPHDGQNCRDPLPGGDRIDYPHSMLPHSAGDLIVMTLTFRCYEIAPFVIEKIVEGYRIERIDPTSGLVTMQLWPRAGVTDPIPLIAPSSMAFDSNGQIIVTDSGLASETIADGKVFRLDTGTGQMTLISAPGHLVNPAHVLPEPSGTFFSGIAFLALLVSMRRQPDSRCRMSES